MLTQEKLAECIESRRSRLTRMATNMLDDPIEAEDVVQDAALSALAAATGFRHEADLCTWFQRVCLNSCLQAIRRRTSAANLQEAARLERLWKDPHYTVDPEAVILALEGDERVRRALNQLAPDQRTAVVLHDLHAFKTREIAADLGLPLATVKSHLRRGRQALVSLLGEKQ